MAEVPDTVDDAIAELSDTPTTDEVFYKTLPFQGREIASAAVSMAAAGGGGSSSSSWHGPYEVDFTDYTNDLGGDDSGWAGIPFTGPTLTIGQLVMRVMGEIIESFDSGTQSLIVKAGTLPGSALGNWYCQDGDIEAVPGVASTLTMGESNRLGPLTVNGQQGTMLSTNTTTGALRYDSGTLDFWVGADQWGADPEPPASLASGHALFWFEIVTPAAAI